MKQCEFVIDCVQFNYQNHTRNNLINYTNKFYQWFVTLSHDHWKLITNHIL